MGNYSQGRLSRAADPIKEIGDLPLGARYAAIWHLERLNWWLQKLGRNLKVQRVKRDPPADFRVTKRIG